MSRVKTNISSGDAEVLARLLGKELNTNQIFKSKKIFNEIGNTTAKDSIKKLDSLLCILPSKTETIKGKESIFYKVTDLGLIALMQYTTGHEIVFDFKPYLKRIDKIHRTIHCSCCQERNWEFLRLYRGTVLCFNCSWAKKHYSICPHQA